MTEETKETKELTRKELEEHLSKFKRLYRSVGDANKRYEQIISDLQTKLVTAESNLENAQQAVNINKTLLRQLAEENSKKEEGLINLLTQLKKKLREMGYDGNFDSLGN